LFSKDNIRDSESKTTEGDADENNEKYDRAADNFLAAMNIEQLSLPAQVKVVIASPIRAMVGCSKAMNLMT
jgi:hypothetical protein